MGKITSLASLYETWPLEWLKERVTENRTYHAAQNIFGGLPNDENFWMWREFLRIRTGEYRRIPEFIWDTSHTLYTHPETQFHFQHVCNAHPGLLCYTQDPDKGKRDIQTPIKMGRYANKYLSGYDARELACKFESFFNPPELKFARTREAIRRVYDEGPPSCMKCKRIRAYTQDGDYEYENVCPTEVYAGPDTAVAYLGDYTISDGVYARCVVNERHKSFVRSYGYTDMIEDALKKAGYSAGGTLNHCRVLHFQRSCGLVMPYLDSDANTCEVDGDYVRIGYDLEYCADQTDGTVSLNCEQYTCDDCGDRCDEGDLIYVESAGIAVCQHCLDQNFTYAYTGQCQEYVRDSDYSFYEYYGAMYTEDGLDYHSLVVLGDDSVAHLDDVEEDTVTGEFIRRDDAVRVLDPDGNESWTLPDNVTVQNFSDLYFDVEENTVYTDMDYDQALELELVPLDDFLAEYPEVRYAWDYHGLRAGSLRWVDYDFRKAVVAAINSELIRLSHHHSHITNAYLDHINAGPATGSHYA